MEGERERRWFALRAPDGGFDGGAHASVRAQHEEREYGAREALWRVQTEHVLPRQRESGEQKAHLMEERERESGGVEQGQDEEEALSRTL